MTSSVTAPLERQFGQMPGLNQMSSQSSAGASVITLQFSLDLEPRRRRAGGAGGDQRRRQSAAGRPAGAADLRQGQPGRRADPDAGADLEDPAADRGRGPRRHPPRAEDLATAGRRPREHQRRASPGGAHPGQHPRACRLRAQSSTTCARRSPISTSTRPRAISTGRPAPRRSTPTTRSATPRTIAMRSSPTATARRCGSPMSPA